MECRLGDFSSSSLSLDQALALCPTNGRAREVSFIVEEPSIGLRYPVGRAWWDIHIPLSLVIGVFLQRSRVRNTKMLLE